MSKGTCNLRGCFHPSCGHEGGQPQKTDTWEKRAERTKERETVPWPLSHNRTFFNLCELLFPCIFWRQSFLITESVKFCDKKQLKTYTNQK